MILPDDIQIVPDPETWCETIEKQWARRDDRSRLFRQDLGIPTDRPIIMSGHQAEFWHPGILAKYFTMCASAAAYRFQPVWLVVDQDEHAPDQIEVPAFDQKGRLQTISIALGPDGTFGIPTGMRPPISPPNHGQRSQNVALPSIRDGLQKMSLALTACSPAASLARQLQGALDALLSTLCAPAPSRFCTQLNDTSLFRELVQTIRTQPRLAVETYNAAVQAHPDSQMLPLKAHPEQGRYELPLWRLRWGVPRQRVWSDELDQFDEVELAPRALLMTGLLRLAGCELFIHGRGGAHYDLVTEQWFSTWLGSELAPTATVSADLRLPLGESQITPVQVATAHWQHHHARHNPRLLGDSELQRRKQAFVDEIRHRKQAGLDCAGEFLALHAWLSAYRDAHDQQISSLETRAHELDRALAERPVRRRRSWAFPLYEQATLIDLLDAITARFATLPATSSAWSAGTNT